jgi:hypothetical protein
MRILQADHGVRVAFVPTFLDWQRSAAAFAPISYAFSSWGNSSPALNQYLDRHAPKSHAMGKPFMAPVRVQDMRPRGGLFEEADNTETLRQTWMAAIAGGADWITVPTWNDYSEGSSIAPSAQHGWSYLDISAYYLSWWRTGKAPAVVRDAVYLTHRTQKVAARPQFPQQRLMLAREGSSTPRDTVEALVYLTAPAQVTVTVGTQRYTWSAPAGQSAHTVPLGTGTVSAVVVRGGRTTASVTSPYRVVATPLVQDLQYHAVSSLRP